MENIFTLIEPEEKLHQTFKLLRTENPLKPAKILIENIIREMEDGDGNFIQQFQTTGFHSRLWEIYIFKILSENGFTFNYEHNRPDFYVEKNGFDFYVEASLSNEIIEQKFTREYILEAEKNNDLNAQKELIEHYVMRMGSVLFSKMQKEYWKLEWMVNKPLVFAITPAHSVIARFLPDAKIIEYLYGLRYETEKTEKGLVLKKIVRTETHKLAEKEIPSNFFSLENSENVSAIIFSNNCDIQKFNRMSYQNGLCDLKIIIERVGLAFDIKNNALPQEFSQSVIPGDYKEDWNEGVSIFHNPNAKNPLDKNLFENIRQLWINDEGKLDGTMPIFFPFNSKTISAIIE